VLPPMSVILSVPRPVATRGTSAVGCLAMIATSARRTFAV
jgi:hypothetical protein